MFIRLAREEDIPAILEIYGPYVEGTCVSFEYRTPTREEFLERFRRYTAQFPWLVWEEDGVVLGYAYGSLPFQRAAYQWCAEISVYVAPRAHRRGIGRALYAALETIIFQQGYRVIYCLITTDNPGSIAFHKAMGYTQVAELPGCGYKFGKKLGICYLEKRRDFVEIPTKAPVPAKEIVNNDRKLAEVLDKMTLS